MEDKVISMGKIEEGKPAIADFNSKDWWTASEVYNALNVSRDRFIEFVKRFTEERPEWFNSEKRPHNKPVVSFSKDLASLFKNEVEKSRKIPEGWITGKDLSSSTGIRYLTILAVFKKHILPSFPNPQDHSKDLKPQSTLTRYFSPEACAALVRHFEKYPIMPLGWYTAKTLQVSFLSLQTQNAFPKILQILREKEMVGVKLFTNTDGDIVEGFPPEIKKTMFGLINRFNERFNKRKSYKFE